MDQSVDSIRPPVALTWQVRHAVVSFLRTCNNPAGIAEIQKHLPSIPDLFEKLAQKSNDYVRVTLMTTSRDLIGKYHAGPEGPRGRKIYWGLPDVDYGEGWIRASDGQKLLMSAQSVNKEGKKHGNKKMRENSANEKNHSKVHESKELVGDSLNTSSTFDSWPDEDEFMSSLDLPWFDDW